MSIVQDCQDRMFTAYKSRVANKDGRPIQDSTAIGTCVTPPESQVSAEDGVNTSKLEPKDVVASAFQAPPPTPESTLQYVSDLRSSAMPSKIRENNSFSDSAYSSNGPGSISQVSAQSHTQESVQPRPSDDLYSQFPLVDGRTAGEGLQELSFDGSYDDITLDTNDQFFNSWWSILEPEG